MKKIGVIGTGYVGLVSAVCFAYLGFEVLGLDKVQDKVNLLNRGISPIHEPGLEDLLREVQVNQKLSFSSNLAELVKKCDTLFVAVGTPSLPQTGESDLSALEALAGQLAGLLSNHHFLVMKSTVPVGTGREFEKWILTENPEAKFTMISNPEFLREGLAVTDFLNPDRIVVGVETEEAKAKMAEIYAPLAKTGVPILYTDIKSAELIKYAGNGFLAVKIGFMNDMARFCDQVGANVDHVIAGIGSDKRIGPGYLQPGPGFGGSCFPKDTLALRQMGRAYESPLALIEAVIQSNETHKKAMVDKIVSALGEGGYGKVVGILGLAFKANTDDVRESSAVVITNALLNLGVRLQIFDPVVKLAKSGLLTGIPEKDSFLIEAKDAYEAAKGADAIVILTEWPQFLSLNWAEMKTKLKSSEQKQPLVIDLRNLFSPKNMIELGIDYLSLGRPSHRMRP